MKCIICGNNASYGEYLYLNWGQKAGKIDTYLVTACNTHRQEIRERVVRMFGSKGGRNQRGPLVAGIIHVIPLNQERHKHKVVIWSNIQNSSAWNAAGKIWKNTFYKDGSFQQVLGNPLYVNRYDWRGYGWKGYGLSPNSPKYDLQPLNQAEYGNPYVILFLRKWVIGLPSEWEANPVLDFPEGY